MPDADVAVVGGGIIGLATARELLRRGRAAEVLEAEQQVGTAQSGRNSGVLHAGLYYRPGSLKARLCTAGRVAMEAFCDAHGVPWRRTGKLVVATDPSEVHRLRELQRRAEANGVPGVRWVEAAELTEHEPHVRGVAGLWVPVTGVTDFRRVCDALAAELIAAGGAVHTGVRVDRLEERDREVVVHTASGAITASRVVVCAGLYADRLAGASGDGSRIVPFRGSFHRLRAADAVRGNVYPVPDPRLPFLGVHATRRIDGEVWLGPNAVLALARNGRRRWSVDRRDLLDTLTFPGTWRLLRRYPRTAAVELWRDLSRRAFLRAAQRMLPDLSLDDLEPGPWGVRAQLVTPTGELVDDFVVHRTGRVLHVRNAPSPAATAALAIAELIVAELEG